MSLDILITVAVTSFVQSIFGVGVLLFGTPLLLLQGYSFIESVNVLLPISLLINLVQVAKNHRSVDWGFYKKVLVYASPFIVIFLLVVTAFTINIGLVVGIFLLLVASKDYFLRVNKVIHFFIGYERIYLGVTGMIHGLTNLGGSLLSAIVYSKGYNKRMTRATVAATYATFATFQILTLSVAGHSVDLRIWGIGIYLIVAVSIFTITEMMVYRDINSEYYRRFFAVFLALSGVLLCVRSI